MDKIFVQISPTAPTHVYYAQGDAGGTFTIPSPASKQLLTYCHDNHVKMVQFDGNPDYVDGYIQKIKTEELTTYNENKIVFINTKKENPNE